jgi:hypothetical protein
MATQPTDFSGLSNQAVAPPQAYAGVTPVEQATGGGNYEVNRSDIRKPFKLPIYKPPPIQPIF